MVKHGSVTAAEALRSRPRLAELTLWMCSLRIWRLPGTSSRCRPRRAISASIAAAMRQMESWSCLKRVQSTMARKDVGSTDIPRSKSCRPNYKGSPSIKVDEATGGRLMPDQMGRTARLILICHGGILLWCLCIKFEPNRIHPMMGLATCALPLHLVVQVEGMAPAFTGLDPTEVFEGKCLNIQCHFSPLYRSFCTDYTEGGALGPPDFGPNSSARLCFADRRKVTEAMALLGCQNSLCSTPKISNHGFFAELHPAECACPGVGSEESRSS